MCIQCILMVNKYGLNSGDGLFQLNGKSWTNTLIKTFVNMGTNIKLISMNNAGTYLE